MSRPTSGPPPSSSGAPSILQMAAPLVVSFWMRAAVTLIDTVYASLLGDPEVAAIGLVLPLEFVMIAVWVGLSTGLTSALSRAIGAGEGSRIERYLAASWRMVGLVAPLFTIVGAGIWFVAPRMALAPEVWKALQVYGTVLIGGSAFTTFWSIIPDSLVKAHQDTRSTMWAGIWTNLINLGLNTLFLFVFEWGIFGIALSTVLGRFGGLAYALHRAGLHERRRRESGETPGTGPEPHPYRVILKLAVPSSLTFVLIAVETALVNYLLSRTERPTEAIAAYSIYYRVVLFGLQPVIATAVAMLPYAARRLGSGDLSGVHRGLRDATLASIAYSIALLGPVMLLAGPWIAARLSESEETLRYAAFALRVVPLACLTGSPFLLCRPVFEAMNRGRPGLLMAALRYLVLTGPLAWAGLLVAGRIGQPPLFGMIVGLLVAAAVSSALFHAWLLAALRAMRDEPGPA